MAVRSEALASRVAAHAGVSTPLAEYAVRAVLAGIGGYLSPAYRQLLAEELPPALAAAIASEPNERRPLEDRVQLVGMTTSQTHELIASVCRALADALSDEANRALLRSLPPRIGSLFVTSSPAEPHATPHHRQTNSVGEPNPHGETKLSSTRGITQERERETLAEAWPARRHRMNEPN